MRCKNPMHLVGHDKQWQMTLYTSNRQRKSKEDLLKWFLSVCVRVIVFLRVFFSSVCVCVFGCVCVGGQF